jgi:hypothetical protein
MDSISLTTASVAEEPGKDRQAVTVILSIAFWPSLKTSHEFGVARKAVWRDDFNVANEPG